MLNISLNKCYFLIFTIGSFGSYFIIAYFLHRENIFPLFGLYALLSGLYFFILVEKKLLSEYYYLFIFISFIFRLLFFPSSPELSDDFYRFIWDGRLTAEGLNPFAYLPNQVFQEKLIDGISNTELFLKMNSPNYYSIYPPILQFIFLISVKLSFGHNNIAVFNMRIFILLAEFGTYIYLIKILDFLKFNKTKVFLYLLNPLVVIELTGNLHFEAVMIFFLTASIYYLIINKLDFSSILIALSICTKMVPLLFIPIIVKKIGFRSGVRYSSITFGIIFLSFLPFIDNQLFYHIGDSIMLYFQKFEFNASFYYLLREIGYNIVGYNAIGFLGKVLPIISTSLILIISFRGDGNETWEVFFSRALKILFIFYLFSLVVHPWYISLLVLISVLTQNRFAIVWSIVIFGSYFAYSYIPFKENLVVNAFEYTVVIIYFFYENKKLKSINILN